MNKSWLLIFSLLCFSSNCLAKGSSIDEIETVQVNSQGTKDQPIILDVSNSSTFHVASAKPGIIYLRLINMLPSKRSNYIIKISETPIAIAPFVRPEKLKTDVLKSFLNDIEKANGQETSALCESLYMLDERVNSSSGENKEFIAAVSELGSLVDKDINGCGKIFENARKTYFSTMMNVEAQLSSNSSIEISVTRPGSNVEPTKATFAADSRQWMRHVGFTFIDNGNELYYSKKVTPDTGIAYYEISAQNSKSDITYAASVMFTYPFYLTDNRMFGIGWSAGLGAASDTIQVSTGPSLIIAENFIINFGYTAMQVEKLKGTYEEGQNLGEESLDSTAMTEKQFDAMFGITLGYKF